MLWLVLCSCPIEPLAMWPPDGATNAPIDAQLFVATMEWDHTAFELRDDTGPVAFTVERHYDFAIVHPDAPLAPSTTYTIAHDVRTSTFTTGTELAPTIAFAGLDAWAPQRFEHACGSNSCLSSSHISRSSLAYTEPDAALVVFQQWVDGEPDSIDERGLSRHAHEMTSYGGCRDGQPWFEDGRYCARLVAYDGAGRTTGMDAVRCTAIEACAPELLDRGSCTYAPACFAPAIDEDHDRSPPASGCGGAIAVPFSRLRRRR